MNPGYLRKRITVNRPVKTRAANGEQIDTMTTVAVRWGSLKADTGGEGQIGALQVQAIQQWTVRLRYESSFSDMVPDWELLVDGLTLRITSIDNLNGLNRELSLKAVQVAK